MDAILYIRFSTADQVKGDSIKRQTELATKAAKKRGYKIVETLADKGKSAYHGKHRVKGGQLYEIEERAKRGELAGKVLLVEAMDRLTRQKPLESITLIRDLTENGLTICETSSDRIYNTKEIDDNWTNLIVILAGAAEAYGSSHEKSNRVRSAWRATQSGQGMKDSKGADPRLCPDWMEVVGGVYVERKERADMIRTMFEMSATGYGLRAISNALKDQQKQIGWPKGELDIRRIGQLLRSRRTIGEYQPQGRTPGGKREDTGDPVKLYPPIVPLDLFYEVQKGLDSRKGTGGSERRKAINVLSHLCRCQYHNEGEHIPCGSKLTYKGYTRASQQPQLTCTRYVRAAGCKSKTTYRYQSLLDGILDHIGTLHLPDKVGDQQPANLSYEWVELNKKKERIALLADKLMLEDDPDKEAAYQRFKASVAAEEKELRERTSTNERASVQLDPREMIERAQSLRTQMQDSVEARLQMQTHLDNLIDVILMAPSDRSATVVMFEGLVVFKLDKAGKLVGKADAMPVLDDTMRARLVGDDVARAATLQRVEEAF